MAAVTICSDFEAQKNSLSLFPLFPHLFAMKWWDQMPWSSFFEWWVLSQIFPPFSLTFIKRVFSLSQRWDSFVVAVYVFFLARLFPPLLTELTPPHAQYLISCITSSQILWPFELLAWSLCWDDLLDKAMATYSNILAWRIPWRRIPWTEDPGGLQSMGSQRVRHDWVTNTHTHTTQCTSCPCLHNSFYTSNFTCVDFFFFSWLYCVSCGILVPWPGIEPVYYQCRILTTGPPGKSPVVL